MLIFVQLNVFVISQERDFMDNLRASVDKNACIGCAICIDICPSVFEFDPQGLSEATTTFVDPSLNHNVRAAADACPTNAIRVY